MILVWGARHHIPFLTTLNLITSFNLDSNFLETLFTRECCKRVCKEFQDLYNLKQGIFLCALLAWTMLLDAHTVIHAKAPRFWCWQLAFVKHFISHNSPSEVVHRTAQGEPAVSYRWTGWVWEITRLKLETSGELPIILEESIQEYISNG